MTLTAYTREHHFYVAIAKHVFLHADKGIVFVNDPIRLKDAEKFDLKPLVLYGLTVPGTQIEWQTFSLLDEPRSLSGVLLEGWEKASGLRGYPDKLKINRHIANACPQLQKSLDHIGGISLEIADGRDKQFSASLRVAQQRGLELGWYNRDGHVINDVKELNDHALNIHNGHVNGRRWEWIGNNAVKEQASKWMALPFKTRNTVLSPSKLDWVSGSWLSSWETTVPQNQKMHVWRHETKPGCYWLLSGEYENIDDITDEDWDRRCALKAKILVDCWPNKPGDIAKAIGITVKQLLWFLNGQMALPETEREDLSKLLGIEASARFVDYDAIGPCVLIAEGPKKCSIAYEELSNGGDLEYSVEVLPEKGTPDPSWRYVVFSAYGRLPNIFMFQRGSKTTDQLGGKLLMNYQGERKVPASIYRDVVSTCAQCSTHPLLNRKLMTEFGERYKHFFQEMGTKFYT